MHYFKTRLSMAAALLLAAALVAVPAREGPVAAASAVPVAAQAQSVSVPVLMYHSILKNKQRLGRYTISPDELEADLQYLCAQGYTTVVAADLIRFVEDGVPLPDKPVVLTFDDGHYNNVVYAEPLLAQYGMRAIIFVVGAFSEQSAQEGKQNPNYSYVDWDTLDGMAKRGVWDIQSHTWNMHESCGKRYGIRRMKHEDKDAYQAALDADTEKITARLHSVTGTAPVAFAYPFGCRSDTGDELLQAHGYKITFGCEDKVATLTRGDPGTLLGLCRLLRTQSRRAEALLR